jgi:hypothetical protein
VGYCFPYVLALLPKFLEVRTLFGTQTLGPHTNPPKDLFQRALTLSLWLQCKRCPFAEPS